MGDRGSILSSYNIILPSHLSSLQENSTGSPQSALTGTCTLFKRKKKIVEMISSFNGPSSGRPGRPCIYLAKEADEIHPSPTHKHVEISGLATEAQNETLWVWQTC